MVNEREIYGDDIDVEDVSETQRYSAWDVFQEHVRPEVQKILLYQSKVTWDEYEQLRPNDHERRLLHDKLDDAALLKLFERYARETGALGSLELPVSAADAIQRELAPLLARRVRILSNRLAALEEAAEEVFDEMVSQEKYNPFELSGTLEVSASNVVPLAVALYSGEK